MSRPRFVMRATRGRDEPPAGGIALAGGRLRRWRWSRNGQAASRPLRCRAEQWYLVRGAVPPDIEPAPLLLHVRFLAGGRPVCQQAALLSPAVAAGSPPALLGWIRSPAACTHVCVLLPVPSGRAALDSLMLHAVPEPGAKCHPAANVPRWDATYRPPFPVDRIVLPASLESLREHLRAATLHMVRRPRSLRRLAALAVGGACVLDPQWPEALGMGLKDLEKLAGGSWLVVDLDTFARLLRRAGAGEVRTRIWNLPHQLPCARVQYADVPTRGFALLDVFPYGYRTFGNRFAVRALLSGRGWRAYARSTGFAELLTSEADCPARSGHVLAAACAFAAGELLVSDAPWLAAGHFGPPAAPRLALHLARVQLAQPLADCVQYWTRWDDADVIVRDIADLARRFAGLHAVRWADRRDGAAQLGLSLAGPAGGRHLMLRTGRIDSAAEDGVPPEPMMILWRWLAREAAEQTPWARRHLAGRIVTWQFDAFAGRRYALQFTAATELPAPHEGDVLNIRTTLRHVPHKPPAASNELVFPRDLGHFGDGSLAFLAELARHVRAWLEGRPARASRP